MTDMSADQQQPEQMQVDAVSSFARKPTVEPFLAKAIPSRLAFSLILAYAFSFKEIEKLMTCLSKKSAEYLEKNRSYLRHFVYDEQIKSLILSFGINQC